MCRRQQEMLTSPPGRIFYNLCQAQRHLWTPGHARDLMANLCTLLAWLWYFSDYDSVVRHFRTHTLISIRLTHKIF